MFVIFEDRGKQYKVSEGDVLYLDKIDKKVESLITMKNILFINEKENIKYGNNINNVNVILKIKEHIKGKKVIAFKYKPKKNYRKKIGHRQLFTKVSVKEIKYIDE